MVVGGAAGRCENGGGVAPVEEEVQGDAERGRGLACEEMNVSGGILNTRKGEREDAPSHETLDGLEHSETSTAAAHVVRP
jgi:hypothetical protein